jgi:simple sugar transport system ATP-binding protein
MGGVNYFAALPYFAASSRGSFVSNQAGPPPAIELIGVDKSFGPVHANKNVNLSIERGVIHGIVGENGAGKSTLMSILYGFYEADAGEIRVNGEPVRIRSSREAIGHGIGMVHQHFMLVPPLSVLENVMLGAEGGSLLKQGAAAIRAKLAHLAKEYALDVDPDAIVGDLSVGLQQRVEILKALVRGAEILVLDEPTAVLTPSEADQLFTMLRVLKSQNKTIVFITHKLREIMALTDRVSVMRRGEMVATFETAATSPPELADAMVGRKVILKVDKGPAHPGAVVLEARGLTVKDDRGVTRLEDVSFNLRAGEILGVAGVAGNGQSELSEALAGMRGISAGEVLLNGVPLVERSPKAMRRQGVGHVPEDRHRIGLVMPFQACESAMLGFQDEKVYGAGLLFDRRAIVADEAAKMEAYDIRPRAPLLKTANFSGGNQQKIVLAREIERNPAVILVGQPTRGVDIGAIEFIHKRIVAMRDAGKAVLLVSVELDEIFALSDRILVLCAGRVTGERRPEETNAQDLGLLMAGVSEQAA